MNGSTATIIDETDVDEAVDNAMVFGGKHDGLQRRCSTWEQAASQHLDVCREVFGNHF